MRDELRLVKDDVLRTFKKVSIEVFDIGQNDGLIIYTHSTKNSVAESILDELFEAMKRNEIAGLYHFGLKSLKDFKAICNIDTSYSDETEYVVYAEPMKLFSKRFYTR